ncbi:uncharacterized protein LOC112055378 [Bicyclus anynana]|uniref:Uncharacterized protein LOC112055378 n=1 Tax=Bicyclus anynana TaxID=110368 RepID=A0A6J1P1Q2_BICAN|nr:uncharacterized protein LOC112055378 [Bicyclus anynana]
MSTIGILTVSLIYLFSRASCQVTRTLGNSNDVCMRIAKDPYFDIDLVVGEPWRIYYSWNMNLETKCLDLVIRNATQEIIKRIWTDMSEYLEQQPYWEAATLHMSMGSPSHELLLFAAQGAAGTFLAVPNVVRNSNIKPMRKGVPLLKFQMKLIRNGKYLLMMDCHVGASTLSARVGRSYRTEIAAEAAALNLGDGHPACVNEKKDDEQFFLN